MIKRIQTLNSQVVSSKYTIWRVNCSKCNNHFRLWLHFLHYILWMSLRLDSYDSGYIMHRTTAKTQRARRGTKGSNCPWTTSILRASFVEKSSNKKLFMIIVGLRHLWHAFVVVFKPLILETLILGGYNQSTFAWKVMN